MRLQASHGGRHRSIRSGRRSLAGVPRPLEIAACRRLCSWGATGERLDGQPLFACGGCGSEWVPTEQWTPVDWTGEVPEPVQAARRGRGRG